MDVRAKNYGRKWKGQVLGPIQLSTERWSVTVNRLKHASFNKEEIYELRKEETSEIYWQRKDPITD
jgi:ribosomal protein S10